jgi:GAF domain
MKIFSLGLDENYPEYLKRKIVVSNIIGMIIAFLVALPFVFISLLFFSPLAYLPIIAIPLALSTLFFNYVRLHTLARMVISLVPICLASIYQAYLSKMGMAVTPGLAMIMLSFSFIMFVIFDLREKGMLIVMSFIMLTIMLSMDWLNDSLEMELNTRIIETGLLAKMVTVISIISGAGCILTLAYQNKIAEDKAFDLLKDAEDNHRKMAAQEMELKDNLIRLKERQKEENQRQWANEGLAKCVTIIRNQPNLNELCDELISFIVKYVNANQGGLFLLNEDDPEDVYLELTAAYAYERRKFLKKRVDIGEGLLGQTFLEKQHSYFKDIPENYLSITSGLGTANPTSLLFVPLKIDDDIRGVMELASFREFSDFEIRFIETLGENIASTLQNMKINARTKELLAASQQQTEEMKAQEEEMRQNMEELNATQEEMSRKEREYLKRIEELENEAAQSNF